MKTEKFNTVLDNTVSRCIQTLGVKADEYATEDRLHNFKVAAELQKCTPITALTGMMAKHTVSVYDLIQRHEQGVAVPIEMWDEKIGDSINYLLLLSALIQEELDEELKAMGGDKDALIAFMEDENERLAERKKLTNCADVENTYEAGYRAGKCAGAIELARDVSLYLGIDEGGIFE